VWLWQAKTVSSAKSGPKESNKKRQQANAAAKRRDRQANHGESARDEDLDPALAKTFGALTV
jgi:hypothetical protein